MAGKTLTAKFVTDASGVGRGTAQAERYLAGLDAKGKALSQSFDKSTSAVGGMFSRLGSTMGSIGVPFAGSVSKIGQSLDEAKARTAGYGQVLTHVGKVATGVTAAALVGVGAESVKMAADFQTSMSKLVTSGGETAGNLKGDYAGVEALMGQTGTSAQQLAGGLYMINSAGFHGAAGLTVLKAAAQGAKTENADVATVTDGLTTMLNDYGLKASDAAEVTSKMVAATSLGKTTFQDLAGSLHTVSPAAEAAGLSMNEVLGAMATMTAKGTPAADAATYLRQTILNLSNPMPKAANEMRALGLNAVDVSQNLGKRGLTGTFDMLTQAIKDHLGPAGTVLVDNLKQAAAAGSGWAKKLQELTPAEQAQVKALADMGVQVDKTKIAMAGGAGAMGGTGKAANLSKRQIAEYKAQLAALPAPMRSVVAGLIANKQGYTDLNSTIAKLPPAQQTAVGALADMVGGTKSMQAALELTGVSAGTFHDNVGKISKATTEAGGNVAGWATVQKNFNQQLSEAKGTADALAIRLGTALIPKVEAVMMAVKDTVKWFQQHSLAGKALAAVLGGVLAVAVGAFAVNVGVKMVGAVKDAVSALGGMARGVTRLGSTVVDGGSKFVEFAGNVGSTMAGAGRSVASFAARTAGQTVQAARSMGVFVAEHAVAAATFIAQNVAMAASATAAFIAENAATLGIVAGIAALVAGIVYVATHWTQVWGDIKKVAADAWHFLDSTWHSIDNGVRVAWGAIGGFLKEWWPEILGVFTFGMGAVVGLLIQHWSQVTGMFSRIWGDVTGIVSRGVGAVVGFFEQLPGDIARTLGNAGSWLYNAGQDIIRGLWNGISGMGSWLWGQVSNFVRNAVESPVKSILGIFSPSRVMAEHGKQIPAGLAVGINGGAGQVSAAMSTLAAGVAATPIPVPGSAASPGSPFAPPAAGASGFAPPAAGASGFAAAARPASVAVYVQVQGSVMAENDLANTVQRALLRKQTVNGTLLQPLGTT